MLTCRHRVIGAGVSDNHDNKDQVVNVIRQSRPRLRAWRFVDRREERRQVQCCCTSPKAVRSIKDRKPRTATSTFTQLLSSDSVPVQFTVAYVHRDHKDYYGRGAQNGHLDFHTYSSWALWRDIMMMSWCLMSSVDILGTSCDQCRSTVQ